MLLYVLNLWRNQKEIKKKSWKKQKTQEEIPFAKKPLHLQRLPTPSNAFSGEAAERGEHGVGQGSEVALETYEALKAVEAFESKKESKEFSFVRNIWRRSCFFFFWKPNQKPS